jgi:hypothetical protein
MVQNFLIQMLMGMAYLPIILELLLGDSVYFQISFYFKGILMVIIFIMVIIDLLLVFSYFHGIITSYYSLHSYSFTFSGLITQN